METLMPIKEINVNKRNYTLDALKFIFALFVILVHFPFPGEVGLICSNIGICGVILFFLISGYSSYNKDDDIALKNILRRFKRNGITLLIVVAIYLVYTILEKLLYGGFNEFVQELADPWRFPRLILLCDLSFIKGDPLWFMIALLWSYIILYFLHKYKVKKYAYYLLPVFILSRVFVECYVNTYGTDWHYTSFFLTSGFPIMLLGNYIHCKKDAFLKAPLYVTIILTIVTTAMMFVTIHIRAFDYDIAQIFKIWCMVELFILALKLPGKKEIPLLSKLGRKYSAYIYLFHFLIGMLVYGIFYVEWVIQICVVIVSVLISILICELVHLIKRKIKSRKVN